MRSGGLPCCDSISRPHRRKRCDHPFHRPSGKRFDRQSSGYVKFCPATMPLSIRIVEPEFPQSSGPAGADQRQSAALHFDDIVAGQICCSQITPSDRMHPSVLAQSAPVE